MDLSFIIRQLQMLSTDYKIALIPIAIILLNLLIFLLSKTFRKAGLFVLILAFAIDYAIKLFPIDLYSSIPWLYNAVTALYILGFVIFFLKVLKMLIRINNNISSNKSNQNSKVSELLKFTGFTPFLIMLIVNVFNYKDIIPKSILTILTSLSFIYMVIKTIVSTSKYLRNRDNFIMKERMDFKEIKDYLKDEESPKVRTYSKNEGRKIRKTFDENIDDESNETIRIYEKPKKDVKSDFFEGKENKIPIKVPKTNEDYNDNHDTSKLSNTEIIKLVSGDFNTSSNITKMTITNLSNGQVTSFESKRPILKIHEQDEYKIDLEFETVNEYDYGRFIDILLDYSKDKDVYKFELEVVPSTSPNNKIIFFDPSNIYDIDQNDYANVSGKIISMNFPKYKINFITGN